MSERVVMGPSTAAASASDNPVCGELSYGVPDGHGEKTAMDPVVSTSLINIISQRRLVTVNFVAGT